MKSKVKTLAEVKGCKAEVEAKARMTDYDDDRGLDMASVEVGRFRGYLDALRWVLGEETPAKCEARYREDHHMLAAETKRMREVVRASGGSAPKQVTIIHEQDFAERRYAVTWEGSDPLETSDLWELKKLIEKWAMGNVPDKTIALEAPRVLAEVIERMKGIDAELTGKEPTPF